MAIAHSESHHDAHVAHHFDSAEQQFDAGKLGMWLFLVTEVLFFSGLFVAYAVYRANHPEVFIGAHRYLNTTLGTFNTIVLLISSLTMAWAVRAAQLGQGQLLNRCLVATLSCASLFLGVKVVEYSYKWGEGLLWAGSYTAELDNVRERIGNAMFYLSLPAILFLIVSVIVAIIAFWKPQQLSKPLWLGLALTGACFFVGLGIGETVEQWSHGSHSESLHASHEKESHEDSDKLTGVFFSIYYAMTGVHAIHILAGMGVMIWLYVRALRSDFGPSYFGPVDYVGLYWHLVDLVWIYLFPLLYLIR